MHLYILEFLEKNFSEKARRMSGFGYLTSAQALHFLPPCQSDGAVYGAAAYACQESGEWRETLRLLRMLRDSWLSPISLQASS